MITFGILTVSDKGSRGQREDKSGETIREMVAHLGSSVVKYEIVPDEADVIADRLKKWADEGEVDIILTTGGTGLSRRDVTPEATLSVIDKNVPGITGAMRIRSLE